MFSDYKDMVKSAKLIFESVLMIWAAEPTTCSNKFQR